MAYEKSEARCRWLIEHVSDLQKKFPVKRWVIIQNNLQAVLDEILKLKADQQPLIEQIRLLLQIQIEEEKN